MQTGTTPSGTVETVPDFRLSLDGSPWPSATGELPAGTGSVVDFQIQRDLTGGGLPGAARGGSGFSVASGSVTLPMGRSELTPWAAASKRVTPGGLAWLRAHPSTLTNITLGRFIVDECSGASTGGLSLALVESQRRMDGPFTYDWAYSAKIPTPDACSVQAVIAEQAGYSTSWQPNLPPNRSVQGSTIMLAARLDGTIQPHPCTFFPDIHEHSGVNWVSSGGQCFLGPGSAMRYWWDPDIDSSTATYYPGGIGPHVTAVVRGAGVLIQGMREVDAIGASIGWHISTTRVRVTAGGVGEVTVQLGATSASTRSLAVRITTTAVIVTDLVTKAVYQAPFSIGATSMHFGGIHITVPADGGVRDVVIPNRTTMFGPAVRPTAFIEHTGSPVAGVFDVKDKSARDVFQDIAKATMGAGWQSETGDLIYRNANSLRTGVPVEAVAAAEKLEDLPWSISRDNTADRITVSYTPADVQADPAHKITLWEATETIQVGAGKTVTVTADITGTTDRISPFSTVTPNQADAANSTYSRWHASSSREGGGTRPADDAIRIESKIAGPSTVRLAITNTTGGTLWLVDGNGNPLVILRTSLQVQPGEPQVLEWGQPEDKAIQPFDFDCGQWVQDASTAQAMLAWLVDQLRSPLPTITQVRIIPDLRRQLGDIVTLTDTESGLKAKALITGTSISGNANGYQQTLSLAILSVTMDDFDRFAVATGLLTFDQLDTWLTSKGLLTFDQADAWLGPNLPDY